MSGVGERWRGAGWELIAETPHDPDLNLALDEVLTRRVGAGLRPPTLRFWGWARPAVILGRFQSVRNEVDLDAARELGVQIVRRISGGGAMFVEPGQAITYSLYLPESYVDGLSFADSYAALDAWVVDGLRDLGVDAWYAPLNDITSAEGKIGGAAQARRARAVLHHTTIAYEMSPERMLRVLRIGREKLSDKGITSAAKRVSPLRRQTNLPREAIVAHLIARFRARFGLADGALTPEDLADAERLVREQFATERWTFDLP
ncbi:MAG TPA: biotin/lipoate A/B protein ligase family protein [Thermomicrobiales bacterium]|nr:biotin/lipoate A/B protein ligase family protein [Thermomicrobiales bacterium]